MSTTLSQPCMVIAGQEARIARMALHHVGGNLAVSIANMLDGWHTGVRRTLTHEEGEVVLAALVVLMDDAAGHDARLWFEAKGLFDTLTRNLIATEAGAR